jgi:methyl-accepting chemotaxis protein
MKIKIKLGIMMIAIVIAVGGSIAVLLLRKASSITIDLSYRSLEHLASQRAEYRKGREDGYLRVLHTLASVMDDFESIPAKERRNRYDEMLRSALEAEPNMVGIYTVWKPNAIDGMDKLYMGRTGSSSTGQYAMAYTKENGRMEARTSTSIESVMAHITGPDAEKDMIYDPSPKRVNGKDTFAFFLLVPITNHRTGEIVGGLGCLLAIDGIQPVLENTLKTFDEIAMMVIYSGNGTILGHFIPDRIGKKMLDVDVELGDRGTALYHAIQNGTTFKSENYDPTLDINIVFVVKPFEIGNSGQNWAVLVGASESYVLHEVNSIKKFTIILAVIALVISALVVYFVLGGVTRPIVKVAETLKDISSGEGDLTRSITVNSKDELGDLAHYFNLTLEKIKNLVVKIKKETIGLSDTGNDLANNMTETASAVNQITANIRSIKGRVINQSASVTETNVTMGQVVSNINKLNGYIEDQNGTVSRSSSAIEEMAANINSVTGTLVSNSINVKTLRDASEAGRQSLQDAAADVQEIDRESEGLLEINAVMANIASQTNLLSMNAAIEAAHAGEAGRGFAVVADEIRKLAESSAEQSKTIGVVLKKIKDSFGKITVSTENVLTKFEAIDSSVRIVAEQEENIRRAMEEQREGSKQLLQGAVDLKEITCQVRNGSREMLEGSKEVIQESSNLEKATQEITVGMNEMASGADQINVAVNHVNEISGKNREGIEALMREVSRFKVD